MFQDSNYTTISLDVYYGSKIAIYLITIKMIGK